MASRDCVARGLSELRAWWQSMPDTPQLLESTHGGCEDYDDAEFSAAIKRLTREHGKAWPPKLADIRAMCAAVAGIRRADAVAARRQGSDEAYCPACGTTALTWSPLWPNGKARMVPDHIGGCVRFNAESRPAAAVNMAAWPSLKPRAPQVAVSSSRGPAALSDVVGEVAP